MIELDMNDRFMEILRIGPIVQPFISRVDARIIAAIQPSFRSFTDTYPWVHDQPRFIFSDDMYQPCDIAASLNGELFILADETISVYTTDGVCLRTMTDLYARYTQLIIDEVANTLIVYEHISRSICILDPITFSVQRTFTFSTSLPYRDHCGGMAIVGNCLFISHISKHRIVVYHMLTGDFLYKWGSYGQNVAEFNRPLGIRIKDDHLFVCDSGNKRVQRFTLAGAPVDCWPTNFFVDPFNEFPSPNTLDFCINGDILIVDCFGIRRFTKDGVFLYIVVDFISNYHPDPDMFKYGIGDRYIYTISVMKNGYIAVCDRFSSRVMILDDHTEMRATDAAAAL